MLSLATKVELYTLDERAVWWAKNCLDGQAQRLAVNGSYTTWMPVSSTLLHVSVPGPVLFNVSMSDLEEVMEPSNLQMIPG